MTALNPLLQLSGNLLEGIMEDLKVSSSFFCINSILVLNAESAMTRIKIRAWRYPVDAVAALSMRIVNVFSNEKGNTTCEICFQPFKPGYTSPSQLFHDGGVPMNFRGNWEISRRDLYNHDSLESDEYIAPSSTSIFCCRVVAILFIILVVLRHMLPIIVNGTGAYSITIFMLHLLMVIGILLPICIMARALTAAQHLHQQQTDLPQTGSQPHLIHVH
ncbi:hypothetical protein L1987_34208 [Smallanthus sonchifolius]|uniref:Uncharacterized protein n=1 Tax=Smallanthus sonchifolius TaxID=185202 RepID=A0ACB9HSH3_9ASTR|nr:hypothetical protein L1987_34208 [Smallanthus sonchifolius]